MIELPHEEEVLDLVNENDEVVGTITHDKVFDFKNVAPYYLRAVNAFIINSDGKLWIPRRTAHKKIAPDGLDFSVG
jgi:isopentenyl-diphosphate delta-isomerase